MFSGTDDDDLFNPAASSKLAALFNPPMNLTKSANESLTYTPPRQPKSATDSPKRKPQSSVLCAKVVALYKNVDGKFTFQGKYGFALIGDDDSKTYELIAYKDKFNILTRAKIHAGFTFNSLRDNYASFFDDYQQNMSVLFDHANDYTEFIAALEKRNVKIVDNNNKKTSDVVVETAETKQAAPAAHDENSSSGAQLKADILSRMAKMGQAVIPAAAQSADSDSDVSSVSRRSRKSKKPPVTTNKPDLARLKHETNAQIVPINQQQQLISPVMDPFSLLLTENRTHNCEIRMNLSQISTKMDAVLQKIEQNERDAAEENLLRAKIKALELKMANLTRELQETVTANVDLQQKLLDNKSSETIEQLQEKQAAIAALGAENARLRQYKKFESEITRCLDLADVKEVCKKYKSDGVCRALLKILAASDGKATNFVGKLVAVMDDFQQYIVKHVDAENNSFPAEFVGKLLPKSTRTATNYLIKEFEKDFKISDEEADRVFKPSVNLSEFDD